MKKTLPFIFALLFFSCSEGELAFNPLESSLSITSVQTFGGSRNDSGRSIITTSDGGFAILGFTQSMDGDILNKTDESFDFWLLKFDENANLLWNKTYGGLGDDRGRDVIQTQDGGFAILGYSDNASGDVTVNNGSRDFWLAKLNANGNLVWQQSFGFSGADEGTRLIETSDNHLLISGVLDVTASGGLGNSGRNSSRHAGGDYWAIKVSNTGAMIWSRYYGGSFTDTPEGLAESATGEFIFAGGSDSNDVDISNNKGSYDFWVVKSDANGDMIWEKSFGGAEIDEVRGMTTSNDGNYIIVGDTRSSDQDVTQNNGGADVWMIGISDEGSLLWNRSYGGSSFDVARSVETTSDDGFIIAGSTRSSNGDVTTNKGLNDAWVVKTDRNGQLLWQHTIGGSEVDFGYDAIELKNGSIIVVGESSSSDGDVPENKGFTDLLLIKLN